MEYNPVKDHVRERLWVQSGKRTFNAFDAAVCNSYPVRVTAKIVDDL
jgi:hypothetical protein